MSESKHTPGPWIFNNSTNTVHANRADEQICWVKFADNGPVIAAAPLIYAALRKIASCESHYPGDVVAIARAALAAVETP